MKKVNAWTCALLTTDRDLESSRTIKKVNAWICAPPTTHHDPASVISDKKRNSVTTFFADLMFVELVSLVTIVSVFFYLRNGFGIYFLYICNRLRVWRQTPGWRQGCMAQEGMFWKRVPEEVIGKPVEFTKADCGFLWREVATGGTWTKH